MKINNEIFLLVVMTIMGIVSIWTVWHQDKMIKYYETQYNGLADDYQRFRIAFDKVICDQPLDSITIGEIRMYFTQPEYRPVIYKTVYSPHQFFTAPTQEVVTDTIPGSTALNSIHGRKKIGREED